MVNLAAEKTIDLYKDFGWKKVFARIRFWDAPFIEIEKLVPKTGVIVDLGCGEGLFANYLALSSPRREIYGIEIDKRRITQANRSLPNTNFLYGDITKINIPLADTIILFHVLHHLKSFKEQEELLKKCVQKLKRSGKLIIAEVEPGFDVKYVIAYLTDHFLVPWIFNHRFYDPIFFRKKDDWQELLIDLGFKIKVLNASRNKPFPHVIFVCNK